LEARHLQRAVTLRHAGEREVADRDDVRPGIVRESVAAAVAECVKLLDIADRQASLRLHPRAQADFECAVSGRIEWSGWQSGTGFGGYAVTRHQNRGPVALERHDCGRESDLNRREAG